MKTKKKPIIVKLKDIYLHSKSIISENYIKNFELLKNNLNLYKYKFNNLSETNLSLGVFHLQNGKISDAILRFKIIKKIFPWCIDLARYWLGWCYFLKNDLDKARQELILSEESEARELLLFIDSRENIKSVPIAIWNLQRELVSYPDKNLITTNDFAASFIKLFISTVKVLPPEFICLEIGYINYNFARELKRRSPGLVSITLAESSEKLIDEITRNYQQYYDETDYYQDLNKFLLSRNKKFHFVYSCMGMSYFSQLEELIENIFKSLYQFGYFMLISRGDFVLQNPSAYCLNNKSYIYNHDDLKKLFSVCNFSIIYSGRLPLSNKQNFSIIIGQKN